MRRWLIVINDARSEIDSEAAAEAYFRGLIDDPTSSIKVALVRRGGILAEQLLGSFVSVRHERMGRPAS